MSALFGFNQVIGTVGGGVLVTDPNPNSTPPSASRIVKLPVVSALPSLHVYAVNGTTVTGRLWALEETTQTWIPVSASLTATPSAPGEDNKPVRASNARAFFQITANTGVEQIGYAFREGSGSADSGGGGGAVNSVTATAPLTSSGGANPDIAAPLASAVTSGLLSAIDFVKLQNLTTTFVQPMVVFRPGVASADNHVATWAEVETFVNATDVPATVFVDSSIAAAVVPATANLDCKGQITFAPNTFGIAGVNFLDFDDGATLRRPYAIKGPLYLRGAPTVDPMITLEDAQKAIFMREGAGIVLQAGALVSPIYVTGDFAEVVMFEGAIFDNAAAPAVSMIEVDVAVNIFIFAAINLISFSLPSTTVSGGAAATTLFAVTDGSTSLPAQPGFAGPISRLRFVQAANLQPSSGNTASRPTLPNTGEMYFDTDLGAPIWWGGTAWARDSIDGSVLTWGSGDVGATVTTRYLVPGFESGLAPITPIQFRVPYAGVIDKLYVRQNTPDGNGNDIVYAVRVNGAASGISVTMASTASDGSDTVNTASIAAGDLLDLEVTKALDVATAPQLVVATLQIRRT